MWYDSSFLEHRTIAMVIPSKAERKRPTVEHENAVYIAGSLYAIFFGLLGTLVVWDLPVKLHNKVL